MNNYTLILDRKSFFSSSHNKQIIPQIHILIFILILSVAFNLINYLNTKKDRNTSYIMYFCLLFYLTLVSGIITVRLPFVLLSVLRALTVTLMLRVSKISSYRSDSGITILPVKVNVCDSFLSGL